MRTMNLRLTELMSRTRHTQPCRLFCHKAHISLLERPQKIVVHARFDEVVYQFGECLAVLGLVRRGFQRREHAMGSGP